MSSPNTGPSVEYSTSPTSPSTAAAVAAAVAAGRKRQMPSAPSSSYSPNETLNQMTQEAEARQHDKDKVQKEIRAIRAQEMEKQRKADEEKENNENARFNRITSGSTSNAGAAGGNASLPPVPTSTNSTNPTNKQRIYSTNRFNESESNTSTQLSNSNLSEQDNPKELKKKLAEMEEKYKKHAIYQTQFENDNQKLLFEVDILKDLIEEHEELIIELRRQFKEKSRELDYQKRANKDLQTDFIRLKEILKQRDLLIEDSGLVLYTDNETKQKAALLASKTSKGNVDTSNEIKSILPAALVAPETAKLLDTLGEGTIDDKLRKLLNEKQDLKEQNNRLATELDDEKTKSAHLEKKLIANANKLQDNQENSQELHEIQRQYTKETNELKMKIQKIEHENIIIKQDKQRLDTQLKYLQTNFDELEQTERRLIKEKRECQRELNESKMTINDLQLKIDVLQKTLEKKRQPSKFIDTSATSSTSTFNSLSLTASVATPTQLNSPLDTNFSLNHNSTPDPYSNDSLFSLPPISNTATSSKPSLNGIAPNLVLNDNNQVDQQNNNNNSNKNNDTNSNTRTDNASSAANNNKTSLNLEENLNSNVTSSNSLSTEDSSVTNSPTISSSSSSMSTSSSTSPSHSNSQQQDDSNLTTPIKIHKLSTSIIDNQEDEIDDKINKESNNAR